VAWITPHKEHRSTFFEPRSGVAGYVRYLRQSRPESRWQALDLDRMRARSAAPAAHRIASVLRDATGRSGSAR
jgi:hypothetical protein